MKLSTKFIIGLLLGIGAAMAFSQAWLFRTLEGNLASLAKATHTNLGEREKEAAHNTFISIEQGVRDSLERGEMEKFNKILKHMRALGSLQNYVLIGRGGEPSYTSHPEASAPPMPPEIKEKLLGKLEPIFVESPGKYEIYQPIPIVGDCLRCHHDWPASGFGGAHYISYSTKSLVQNRELMNQKIGEIRADSRTATLLAVAVSLPIIGTLIYLFFHYMVNRPVGRIVQMLDSESAATTTLAEQLTVASHAVAEGSSEQAATLEETSASMEEMASMTRQNAENTDKAKHLAEQTRASADTSLASVEGMSASMQDIAQIVRKVDEIAFQTNILALNAAVEAARAGEAGAGFAVVADEVRNLAKNSADAARDITHKIEAGVKTSVTVRDDLVQIVGKIRSLSDLVAQTAVATREQSEGIGQVNTAIAQMDQVTQGNAASAEQTAGAVAELTTQARELKTAVSQLVSLFGVAGAVSVGHHHIRPAHESRPAPGAAAPSMTGLTSGKTAAKRLPAPDR